MSENLSQLLRTVTIFCEVPTPLLDTLIENSVIQALPKNTVVSH